MSGQERGACGAGEGRAGRAAMAQGWAADPETLHRVISALLSQLGGALPVTAGHEPPGQPGGCLERRAVTPLRHVRGLGGGR
jgi:hypothetical protein